MNQPTQGPPVETGERLLTCPRTGPRGVPQEMRVNLCEYEGHPYVSLRVWEQASLSGTWFPTKSGTTIRRSELAAVVATLGQVARQMSPPPAPRARPEREARQREALRGLENAPPADRGFDEF